MTDLKPCPFCGGDDVNMGERPHLSEGKGNGWTVLCADCGGSIGYIERPDGHFYAEFDTKSEAIAAWNVRYHCGLTDEDYNILLDELGVSERTCRDASVDSSTQFYCSECECTVDVPLLWGEINYCPNCGARVIGAEAVGE